MLNDEFEKKNQTKKLTKAREQKKKRMEIKYERRKQMKG